MQVDADNYNFELICLVLDFGSGTKAIKIGRENHISGGTIFLGKGTVRNRLLEFLSLDQIRKEIVIMICRKNIALKALERLNEEFQFEIAHHGIAFSIPLCNVFGTSESKSDDININEERGVDSPCIKLFLQLWTGARVKM